MVNHLASDMFSVPKGLVSMNSIEVARAVNVWVAVTPRKFLCAIRQRDNY